MRDCGQLRVFTMMNNKKYMRFNDILDAIKCCSCMACSECPFNMDEMCKYVYDDCNEELFTYLEK